MSNGKDIKTVLDGAVETAKKIMTTEIFHAQLVKNTEAINKEREEYEHKRAELQHATLTIRRLSVRSLTVSCKRKS